MSVEYEKQSVRSQLRDLFLLAAPLVANNLAITVSAKPMPAMAGRLGTNDLAAVALGSNIWMVAFLFGLGVLMAMSPTAAQAFGAGRLRDVGVYARQCLWLSQGLAVISMMALHRSEWLLTTIGVDPAVIPLTPGYLDAISWGLPAMFAYLSLRFMSEGIGWTKPIAYVAGLALVANVGFNWLLMFGTSYVTSAVDDQDRTPDLPVDEQFRLAAGCEYQLGETWTFGANYTFAWLGDNQIDQSKV